MIPPVGPWGEPRNCCSYCCYVAILPLYVDICISYHFNPSKLLPPLLFAFYSKYLEATHT